MKPTVHTASSERHVQQAIYLAESDRGNHNITSLKNVNSPASEILSCRDLNPPASPAGAMACWRSVARLAARRASAERAWPESSRRAGPPTCHLAADRARLGGATSIETRDSSIVIVQLKYRMSKWMNKSERYQMEQGENWLSVQTLFILIKEGDVETC